MTLETSTSKHLRTAADNTLFIKDLRLENVHNANTGFRAQSLHYTNSRGEGRPIERPPYRNCREVTNRQKGLVNMAP